MNKTIAERYELIDIIGQGGMADVYLARDTILNRTIAIKLLRTSLAKDPVYIARFQREASAAAALSHKNIVEIYDVGEDNDQYYIVMEYVPGTTLKDLILKRGALHVMEAIDIMKQVLSGTARAHQMGIIHRDLKPQNILVTDSGVAKIADFGIASIQSLTQFTQTDVIMGSLHYLAPEIARGEKATVQSDIYALGMNQLKEYGHHANKNVNVWDNDIYGSLIDVHHADGSVTSGIIMDASSAGNKKANLDQGTEYVDPNNETVTWNFKRIGWGSTKNPKR